MTGRIAEMVVGRGNKLRFGDVQQIKAIRVLAETEELRARSGGIACGRHGEFSRMEDEERATHLRVVKWIAFDEDCPAFDEHCPASLEEE